MIVPQTIHLERVNKRCALTQSFFLPFLMLILFVSVRAQSCGADFWMDPLAGFQVPVSAIMGWLHILSHL